MLLVQLVIITNIDFIGSIFINFLVDFIIIVFIIIVIINFRLLCFWLNLTTLFLPILHIRIKMKFHLLSTLRNEKVTRALIRNAQIGGRNKELAIDETS